MDISKITDFIKLTSKQYFALTLISGIFLFSPDIFIQRLVLFEITKQIKPWVGLLFIISVILLLVNLFSYLILFFKGYINNKRKLKIVVERINMLTRAEKKILFDYIDNDTRTQYFEFGDGIIQGLVAENILFKSSIIGQTNSWPFNIQPYVWVYLKKNYSKIFSNKEIIEFRNEK